jgi:dihydroxyacetone kinase
MPGFSITLLLLPRPDEEAPYNANQILGFLDDVPDAPAWRWTRTPSTYGITPTSLPPSSDTATSSQFDRVLVIQNREVYLAAIRRACEAISKAEPELTEMDRIAGDGDCGLTLQSGANGRHSKFWQNPMLKSRQVS